VSLVWTVRHAVGRQEKGPFLDATSAPGMAFLAGMRAAATMAAYLRAVPLLALRMLKHEICSI
jgi:hypothetical protein